MIIKPFITTLNHINSIQLILRLSHGWEYTMSEASFMKKPLISLKELLKSNPKKLSGSSWLPVAIEEQDLLKGH